LNNTLKDLEDKTCYHNYTIGNNCKNDLVERDMMAKNMREFVQCKHKNDRVCNASELAKSKLDDLITKNEQRAETHKARQLEVKKAGRKQVKSLIIKGRQRDESVRNTVLTKLEDQNIKRETNQLRKQDQLTNLESLRRQRQEDMLRLQAKHFGVDAKNKLNKVALEHQQAKNVLIETQVKKEISVNDAGDKFKIKSHKHLRDVGHQMDKMYEMDSRIPRGLKTINQARQPVVE